jgi:5-hydroxyisourate hydrolase
MATKDPITCHVLDTTTGRPAAGMAVTLTCRSALHFAFVANTNHEGRIANWHPDAAPAAQQPAIEAVIKAEAEKEGHVMVGKGESVWTLSFNTVMYYGAGKTFFPHVDLTFLVREGEHFHVPLLVGPYSYTTYRGS